MGIPTSPDDATDGNDDYGDVLSRYDTLEQHIYDVDTEKDDESYRSIRVEDWQLNIFNHITDDVNTSISKTGMVAYCRGLCKIRNEFMEDAVDINKMRTNTYLFLEDMVGKDVYRSELDNALTSLNYGDRLRERRNINESISIRVRDSESSEMSRYYKNYCGIGGFINRSAIILGLADSESAGKRTVKREEEEIEMINDIIEDARLEIESAFMRFTDMNLSYWMNNGIDEEYIEKMEEVIDSMDTKYRNDVQSTVDVLKEVN